MDWNKEIDCLLQPKLLQLLYENSGKLYFKYTNMNKKFKKCAVAVLSEQLLLQTVAAVVQIERNKYTMEHGYS